MPHVYMWKEEKEFQVNVLFVLILFSCLYQAVSIDLYVEFCTKNCLTFRGGRGGVETQCHNDVILSKIAKKEPSPNMIGTPTVCMLVGVNLP